MADRFKPFLLGLAERWPRYQVPPCHPRGATANHRTEQAIGRLKSRVPAMRGCKTVVGLEVALLLNHGRLG